MLVAVLLCGWVMFHKRDFNQPEQLRLSGFSENPSRQEQKNDPTVLLQICEHLPLPVAHSSVSAKFVNSVFANQKL